jgi:hypothetical protein
MPNFTLTYGRVVILQTTIEAEDDDDALWELEIEV